MLKKSIIAGAAALALAGGAQADSRTLTISVYSFSQD